MSLILLFINLIATIGFGITVLSILKSSDSEKRRLELNMRLQMEEHARDLDRLNAVRNSHRELEEHLFQVRDQKAHLSKRLDSCNEAYKKAMEMNEHQEKIIDEKDKWTRGRDPKTRRFVTKNK